MLDYAEAERRYDAWGKREPLPERHCSEYGIVGGQRGWILGNRDGPLAFVPEEPDTEAEELSADDHLRWHLSLLQGRVVRLEDEIRN